MTKIILDEEDLVLLGDIPDDFALSGKEPEEAPEWELVTSNSTQPFQELSSEVMLELDAPLGVPEFLDDLTQPQGVATLASDGTTVVNVDLSLSTVAGATGYEVRIREA